jgi:hypothetical protein
MQPCVCSYCSRRVRRSRGVYGYKMSISVLLNQKRLAMYQVAKRWTTSTVWITSGLIVLWLAATRPSELKLEAIAQTAGALSWGLLAALTAFAAFRCLKTSQRVLSTWLVALSFSSTLNYLAFAHSGSHVCVLLAGTSWCILALYVTRRFRRETRYLLDDMR